MSSFQFFGAEPILIDKIIFYTERKPGGRYSFNSEDLKGAIAGYVNAGNWNALRQIVKELFWISDQGRRPWSLESEQAFSSLVSTGHDLLTQMRAGSEVTNEIYPFIDPLRLACTMEHAAECLDDAQNQESRRPTAFLAIFDSLIAVYISIFDCWASDFPADVKLLSRADMEYLLETGNDKTFAVLMRAIAKTQDERAREILLEFCRDEEQAVRHIGDGTLVRVFLTIIGPKLIFSD